MKQVILLLIVGTFMLSACGQGNNPGTDDMLFNTAPTLESTGTLEKAQGTVEPQNEEADISKTEPSANIPGVTNCRVKTPQQIGYTALPRPGETDHSRGPSNAYVTIIEYGDFQ